MSHGPLRFLAARAGNSSLHCAGTVAMPSLYNKMQNCEAVAADGPTAAEQKPNSSHNNLPEGLWIDGVRVDVAGRIAPLLQEHPGHSQTLQGTIFLPRNRTPEQTARLLTFMPWIRFCASSCCGASFPWLGLVASTPNPAVIPKTFPSPTVRIDLNSLMSG